MERLKLRKDQYRLAAVLALAIALLSIWPLERVIHGDLPFWAHLPLAALLLGIFSLSALGAGIAYGLFRTGPYRD